MSQDGPLLLSISGARGIVGRSMTAPVALEFAAAFGSLVRESAGEDGPTVCVGRDSRPSGEMLEHAVVAGLAGAGCRVIRLGVVATPSVAVMIREHGAAGGMVVTASHNPRPWNGLKCLNASGLAPPPLEAAEIVRRFRERAFAFVGPEGLRPVEDDGSTHRRHVDRVLASVDLDPVRRRRYRVVLDSVNGAGCAAGRMLLESLGCEVVHLHGAPTGLFAHPPEPLAAHLGELCERTAAEGAAVGFAQDPDADRLAIIDERGRYIGEEYTLALAAWRMLDLYGGGTLAANLSTSRMIDDIAATKDGAVVRTAVGEAHVVAAMRRDGALLGGEGNGGIIFPPVCWVRDSLSAMALVLSLLAARNSPLSAIVAELPCYEMIKRRFDLAGLGGAGAVPGMLERVRSTFAGMPLNTADGVRVDFPDGWVHLRPSNTEPIVRLIGEAASAGRAAQLLDEVAAAAGLVEKAKR